MEPKDVLYVLIYLDKFGTKKITACTVKEAPAARVDIEFNGGIIINGYECSHRRGETDMATIAMYLRECFQLL